MRNNTIFLIAGCLMDLTTLAPAAVKPNVVFILADDKCWSLTGRDGESRKYAYLSFFSANWGFQTTNQINGNCGGFPAINYTLLHPTAVPDSLDTFLQSAPPSRAQTS